MSEAIPASGALAAKLNRLFRTMRPRERSEYSCEEVAETIASRGGPTISASYLYMLRNGQRDNPTKKHLEALADFFGVPPAYFFDDSTAKRIDAELDLLRALRDSPVRQLAVRAFGLTPESLASIAAMVERVRQLEGVQEVPGETVSAGIGEDPAEGESR